MKSITKKFAAIILSATLSISALTLPATAAWKTTDTGKQWVNTDGSIAKSKWLKMKNGDRYYIKSNGIMAIGVLNLTEKENDTKVKNTYYFNKSGKMQFGWQYVNKKYYYFDKETGKAYKGEHKLDGYTLNFDEKGVWDKKVYKNGKDVTAKTDIAKLTGIAVNPDTITIAGQEYSTKLKMLTLNQPNLTDEDLEPLKYMTNLRYLCIVPGTAYSGEYVTAGNNYYDYKDVTLVGTGIGWVPGDKTYSYEGTRTARDTSIAITNLDFCAYMPKLTDVKVAYAPNLTDLKGLQNLKRLTTIILFNCTGLKDLHDLDNVDFVQSDIIAGVQVTFTENVKYAFTDYYFGARLSSTNDYFKVVPASETVSANRIYELKGDECVEPPLYPEKPAYIKYVGYSGDKKPLKVQCN